MDESGKHILQIFSMYYSLLMDGGPFLWCCWVWLGRYVANWYVNFVLLADKDDVALATKRCPEWVANSPTRCSSLLTTTTPTTHLFRRISAEIRSPIGILGSRTKFGRLQSEQSILFLAESCSMLWVELVGKGAYCDALKATFPKCIT